MGAVSRCAFISSLLIAALSSTALRAAPAEPLPPVPTDVTLPALAPTPLDTTTPDLSTGVVSPPVNPPGYTEPELMDNPSPPQPIPGFNASAEAVIPTGSGGAIDVMTGISASHELGWIPNDDLTVTALENFADLLPQVRQIAGAPQPTNRQEINVADVIRLTLQNSADLDAASYSPRISAHGVPRARGQVFDTEFTASANARENNNPGPGGALGPNRITGRTYSLDAGLSQRLATGGLIDLSYGLSRFRNNALNNVLNPAYTSTITLSATQPLLRGFGPTVTRAPITNAQLEAHASEQDYRQTVINTVSRVMFNYYDLFFALRQAEVLLVNLEQARVVLNNNRIRLRVGDMTRAEVLQAESTVAQREGDYYNSLRAIQDAEDALWLLIDRSGDNHHWDTELVPTEIPTLETMALSEDQLIGMAREMRPDLIAQRLRREETEINRRVAANALLPQLDFVGSMGYDATDIDFGHANGDFFDGDFAQWAVGLQLSYPLQNRAARHGYRQSELRLQQADTEIESLRLQIILGVRAALRALQNALDLIAAREAEVRARELELRDEQRRYEVGLSTTEILLRFQNDLATARINRLSAVVTYAKAIIALDQITGRLLERHGIEIVPAVERP